MESEGRGGATSDAHPDTRGYIVRGRVQGVGFRWWTLRVSEELGLAGSVRNLEGGGVEVHARGEQGALERFEEQLHRGPRLARVDAVDRVPGEVADDRTSFVVVP